MLAFSGVSCQVISINQTFADKAVCQFVSMFMEWLACSGSILPTVKNLMRSLYNKKNARKYLQVLWQAYIFGC